MESLFIQLADGYINLNLKKKKITLITGVVVQGQKHY